MLVVKHDTKRQTPAHGMSATFATLASSNLTGHLSDAHLGFVAHGVAESEGASEVEAYPYDLIP